MRIRYAWALAGLSLLAVQSASLAQAIPPDEVPGGAVPGQAIPGLPGLQGAFSPPPPIRAGQPISVLVFPFGLAGGMEAAAPPPGEAAPVAPGEAVEPGAADAASGSQLTPEQQELVNQLTAAVKAGFLSTPAYSVATYHPQSSLVLRARKDEILRPEHLEGLVSPTGAVDAERARAIAYRLGMQTILVGTVDVQAEPMANAVELTVDAQLLDSTTGKALKTAAVGGSAKGVEGVPMTAVQERAAMEAAQRMLPALGIQLVLPKSGNAQQNERSNASAGKPTQERRAAARAAAKAEREAAEKARAAARTAERERKKQEAAAEKARKESEKKARQKPTSARREEPEPAVVASAPEKPKLLAQNTPAPAQPVPAPAAPTAPATGTAPAAPEEGPTVMPMGTGTGTVQGVADPQGRPVPYGYATNDRQESALPRRQRSGLRVPPWLGLVGFLAGVGFLLN